MLGRNTLAALRLKEHLSERDFSIDDKTKKIPQNNLGSTTNCGVKTTESI